MTRSGKFVVNKVPKCRPEPANPTSNSRQRLTLERVEFVLALVNRLLIGFVTIYMCWMCLRLRMQEIPWHALLCTLGFVCLMSEGLMTYYRGNAWTQPCCRTEKTRTHWILQLSGSVIGLAGILIKLGLEKEHFQSLHGKFGLGTLVLCLLSLFSGLCTLYSTELKSHIQPLLNKALHSVVGLVTFMLAMLSMFYSFETDLFLEYSLDAANFADFRLMLQLMIALIFLLSIYGPFWCVIYSKLWKCC